MSYIDDVMLSCSFNQTKTMFAIGTDKGFRIYKINNEPNYSLENRIVLYDKHLDGGLSIVELYYESNIIALVGGGKFPKYPKNKVVIFDEEKNHISNEISITTEIEINYNNKESYKLSLNDNNVSNSKINNVKIKNNLIVVACEESIHVLNLFSLQEIDVIDISNSPYKCIIKGLFTINLSNNCNIIVYPDPNKGSVMIKNYSKNTNLLLNAHDSDIEYIQLSDDGSLLATISEKALCIRVFRTHDGIMLGKYSLNNTNNAINKENTNKKLEIYCVVFDSDNNYLAANCNNGEIIIFSLNSIKDKIIAISNVKENNHIKYTSYVTKEIIRSDYINSEGKKMSDIYGIQYVEENPYSYFYIKENIKSISAFINNNKSISVITSNGYYYEAKIKEHNCVKLYEISLNISEYTK